MDGYLGLFQNNRDSPAASGRVGKNLLIGGSAGVNYNQSLVN